MTTKRPLPAGTKHYSERLFLEKEKWHRRQARMSFARKLRALDELFEGASALPKPESTEGHRWTG